MVMLSSEVVMRRLQDIHAPTQEAIETMSLWIMHYKDKASIDVIVEGWLNSFRVASNDQRRIALFYVMNDVVQKAKNKHIDTLIPAFQPAVLTVFGIGRKYDKVKEVMRRCIDIFGERHVFTDASVNAMRNLLDSSVIDGYDAEESVLDVDNDEIVRKITAFVAARNVVGDMIKYINEGDFNFRERIKTGMRDREEGAHTLQEVHDSIDMMVKVRHSMETQKKKMIDLIETLELAKRVFMHQKKEVVVVEEAYVNFRDGIKTVRKELMEIEETGVYPGLSPPRDAPSPMATDDIYATGVESAIKHFRAPETWDNRQPMDMEMDEDYDGAVLTEQLMRPPPQPPVFAPLPSPTAAQPSLQSRIMQLGLAQITGNESEQAGGAIAKEAVVAQAQATSIPPPMDFSKPPPVFSLPPPSTETNMAAFGVTTQDQQRMSQQAKQQQQPQYRPHQPPPQTQPQQQAIEIPNISGVTMSRSQHDDIHAILKSIPRADGGLNVQIPQGQNAYSSGPSSAASSTQLGQPSSYALALQQHGYYGQAPGTNASTSSIDVDDRHLTQPSAYAQMLEKQHTVAPQPQVHGSSHLHGPPPAHGHAHGQPPAHLQGPPPGLGHGHDQPPGYGQPHHGQPHGHAPPHTEPDPYNHKQYEETAGSSSHDGERKQYGEYAPYEESAGDGRHHNAQEGYGEQEHRGKNYDEHQQRDYDRRGYGNRHRGGEEDRHHGNYYRGGRGDRGDRGGRGGFRGDGRGFRGGRGDYHGGRDGDRDRDRDRVRDGGNDERRHGGNDERRHSYGGGGSGFRGGSDRDRGYSREGDRGGFRGARGGDRGFRGGSRGGGWNRDRGDRY